MKRLTPLQRAQIRRWGMHAPYPRAYLADFPPIDPPAEELRRSWRRTVGLALAVVTAAASVTFAAWMAWP